MCLSSMSCERDHCTHQMVVAFTLLNQTCMGLVSLVRCRDWDCDRDMDGVPSTIQKTSISGRFHRRGSPACCSSSSLVAWSLALGTSKGKPTRDIAPAQRPLAPGAQH
jgi:hypothetical protein